MAISDNRIRLAALSPEVRKIVSAVNAGTASGADIKASQISLVEKAVLESVRGGTATRESINRAACDNSFKTLILEVAGAVADLLGAGGAGTLALAGVAPVITQTP